MIYKDDLAYIHHTAFGAFARDAAPGLLEKLRGAGIVDGLVVDLACGSGMSSRAATLILCSTKSIARGGFGGLLPRFQKIRQNQL
jgi:hypothetical protein